MNPLLTTADSIVLRNLLHDASSSDDSSKARSDQISKDALAALTDDCSDAFETTVFTGWDRKVLPDWLSDKLLLPYILWAQGVVRRRTDVVFLTHIMLYLLTSVPSALMLYYRFSYTHAVGHWLMQAYYCGPFTLLLHNHIHNGGVLAKKYAWFDSIFPYILEPLMGHTWDSYYYHHVKHHHVEGNGPEDLSSTLRYQRDDLFDFILYVLRFMTLVWIELPLYFLRKHKRSLAIRCLVSEISTLLAIYLLAIRYPRPTTFVFILPHIMMRIGMMVGNWGQHAFIDEIDPASDFRSSITLIDVASNRYCFNDGWHTSHHLNPRRHWRDHPLGFLKAKAQYQREKALFFQNIDYIMITVKCLQKDYDYLARCLVPIGDQIGLSYKQKAKLLRTKTQRFSEDDIQRKFYKKL